MSNHQPVRSLIIFMLIAAWGLSAKTVWAQSSSLSYQGSLASGASPANGLHDFQFKLFDALAGGTQISLTNTATNVSVTNGLFNVTLDFGSAAFPGAPRWLEISVRIAGGGTYTTLSPRQQLSSTPYAVKSLNAASADGLSVTCVGCVTGAQIGSLPTGNGNYIQNTTSPQSGSNFNVSGMGTANILNATTQFNLGGSRILSSPGSDNIFVGVGSGAANTSGLRNAFFGRDAGMANTSGQGNSFFGYQAGAANTGARNNSYFGTNAGRMSTGGGNTFFGTSTGATNITGSGNTLIGLAADVGAANLSDATAIGAYARVDANNALVLGGINGVNGAVADTNVGIGTTAPAYRLDVAGTINTTTQYNIGGNRILSNPGTSNLFAGAGAANSVTTGSNNAFFGVNAGAATTGGSYNAFFGKDSGKMNTDGSFNSFFGLGAGRANLTGFDNSFFGSGAGEANTTGTGNSFFGNGAGLSNLDGRGNSFVGDLAGAANTSGIGNSFFGDNAGNGNETGSDNTFIGKYTGFGNVGGINNTLLGFNANVGQANLINATAIGANAQVNSNNAMVLGDSAVASYRVGIGTNTPFDKFHVTGDIRIGTNALGCVKDADGTVIAGTCFSDLRFKRGVAPFPNLLDKLVKLQPVNFFWRSSEFPQRHFGTEQSYGLIAQEVEVVLPELVSADAEGFKAVNYSKLPLLLLQGMKEQQRLSQQLKQENTELKQQLAAQQLRAQQQEREVRELKRLVCLSVPQADVCQPPK